MKIKSVKSTWELSGLLSRDVKSCLIVNKSGKQGVPQTDIDGQIIAGLDKNRIDKLHEIK